MGGTAVQDRSFFCDIDVGMLWDHGRVVGRLCSFPQRRDLGHPATGKPGTVRSVPVIAMNSRVFWASLIVFACFSSMVSLAQLAGNPSDPMKQLSSTFPDTVEVKNKGRLLEFCPDGTCDGFLTTGNVSVTTLKDFAYLYVYFFSDYTFLDEWRSKKEAKSTSEYVLAKPEYRKCKNERSREAARCVLEDLSGGGKIKLIFVRYDEGERHVVPKNLAERLSKKRDAPQSK